jgi:PhnB protein
MTKVKPIPEGMHTVTPILVINGCLEAIEFYQKAFGAIKNRVSLDPTGKKVWHAALQFGDSMIYMYDEMPEMDEHAHPTDLWLYVENVDAAFKKAVDAGIKIVMEPADTFWGDRICKVVDNWGNRWGIAQHIKDMTPEEIKKATDEFIAKSKK